MYLPPCQWVRRTCDTFRSRSLRSFVKFSAHMGKPYQTLSMRFPWPCCSRVLLHRIASYLASVDKNPWFTSTDQVCGSALQLHCAWVPPHDPDNAARDILHIRKKRKSCFLGSEIFFPNTWIDFDWVQSHLEAVEKGDDDCGLSWQELLAKTFFYVASGTYLYEDEYQCQYRGLYYHNSTAITSYTVICSYCSLWKNCDPCLGSISRSVRENCWVIEIAQDGIAGR